MRNCYIDCEFRNGVFCHDDGRITLVKDGITMEFESIEKYVEFREMVMKIAPKLVKSSKRIIAKLKEKREMKEKSE